MISINWLRPTTPFQIIKPADGSEYVVDYYGAGLNRIENDNYTFIKPPDYGWMYSVWMFSIIVRERIVIVIITGMRARNIFLYLYLYYICILGTEDVGGCMKVCIKIILKWENILCSCINHGCVTVVFECWKIKIFLSIKKLLWNNSACLFN